MRVADVRRLELGFSLHRVVAVAIQLLLLMSASDESR